MKTVLLWLFFPICAILYPISGKEKFQMLVREDKAWDYAVGMIKVDGLEPTPEMKELIEREKRGEITMEQVREALDQRYKMKE